MNWGKGITIVIISFLVGMTTLVVMAIRQDFDLVADNYYEKEINYQQQIDQQRNARLLAEQPTWQQRGDQWLLSFPASIAQQSPTGSVTFLRLSDDLLDVEVPIQLDTAGVLAVPVSRFGTKGVYELHIAWQMGGQSYYIQNEVDIK